MAGLPLGQVPALDGLRGVAVLGVLLFHTERLWGGFLGVDLFFALSGFLITGQLLRELDTGGLSLVTFWGRRARRLLPGSMLLLAVVAVLAWAVAPDDVVRTTLDDGPWVQANLANWHLVAEQAAYWDRFGVDRVFEHLWSIAVEEQFYVVWPLLVLLVARLLGHRRAQVATVVGALAVAVAAASVIWMAVLVDPADPTRVYIGTDTRAASLLLGAVFAVRPVRSVLARLAGRGTDGVAVLLLGGLALSWILVPGTTPTWLYLGGLAAHSMAASLLLALVAYGGAPSVSALLTFGPLRWVGGISYALYLWHWPVMVLLSPESTGLDGWTWTALVIGTSVVIAALVTRFVEEPIRFRASWARGRRGAVVLGGATLALALLWVLLPVPGGPTVDVTRLD